MPKCMKAIKGMPAESIAAMKKSYASVRKTWKESAKTDDGKASLKIACKSMLTSAAESYKAQCKGVFGSDDD